MLPQPIAPNRACQRIPVGISSGVAVAAALARINPHVSVEPHRVRLTAENAVELIAAYDLVIDGSDNFATRYLVSDTCYREQKPLVTAAVGRFDASITTICAHETDKDGNPNPTYRCLFPQAPPEGLLPTCAEAGILGALTGVVGSLQALEAIKLVTGIGEPLIGRLLLFDAKSMRFETIRYRFNPNNPLSGGEG